MITPAYAENSPVTPAAAAVGDATSWFLATKESANGVYSVSLDSASEAAVLNEFQSWILTVTANDTKDPVNRARITVGGGMPMHGHGLPTQPQVTEYLGDGKYKLDGLKFNMHGQWVLEFDIVTADASDKVIFEVILDY